MLKSMTRLLSGSAMEDYSILQEHTLVLAGECVDTCTVWQGWPSETQKSLEVYRESVRKALDHVIQRYFLFNDDKIKGKKRRKRPDIDIESPKVSSSNKSDRFKLPLKKRSNSDADQKKLEKTPLLQSANIKRFGQQYAAIGNGAET